MKTFWHSIPAITLLIATSIAHAGNVRVVATGENWVEVVVDASDLVVTSESPYDRIDIPGWMWLHQPGAPAVPVRGATLGMPYGSRAVVQVLDANYEEIDGLNLTPVPQTQLLGSEQHPFSRSVYLKDETIYDTPGFYPGAEAVVAHTGILRDQQVAILSLRPVQYDPVQRRLRIARQLRVRVLFVSDETRPPIRLLRDTDDFDPIYQKGLLNPEQARFWRGRRIRATKRVQDWYDPTATYYKIRVFEDGLYRLDARWFSESGIVLAPGDLDRLQVFLDGEEIPLLIEDGGDGVLDTGDGVLFWGAFRRAPDRDFESEYGTERVYFLRMGREPGTRYTHAEDTSTNEILTHFLSRKHVEIDSVYEALGHARNANRDHWFWQRTASPSRPGDMPTDVVMPVPLPGLARGASGNAQIRLGMHSLTLNQNINPDHYAVVQIQDGPIIAEDRWDGQDAHIATGTVPVSALSDTTYVVLRTPGDPSFPLDPIPYIDHVYFNWVEITYPRRFEAIDGMLQFNPGIVLSPRAISIANFEHERIRVLNLDKNKIIGTVQGDEGIRFEIAESGNFVAVDETAIKTPELAERDIPYDLRGFSGAKYIIISGADFMDAAERLATHRQSQGLSTLTVDVADIYDEFSFGQVDAEAIRRFVQYGFHTWAQRPVYVLLFGEFSFDYRDLFGQTWVARHNLVPGMPFQSPNRGLAFTDEFFGRVDDDLFMDVVVGRFSIRRTSQANTVVQKVIAYDETPSAQWRNRITLMANWDSQDPAKFTAPSDTLASITHAIGLENFKLYHDADTPPEPNASSREVIRQINEGRLIVNFMGHGSASSMSKFFAGTFQQGAFNYMSQIQNAERLPLFIGMSCLNGLYWDPRIISLAEEMTNKPDGGAIAYISASSLSFIRINNQLNTALFRHTFENGVLAFGQSLVLGKKTELEVLPSSELGLVGMNLIGDPAQKIAVPQNPDFVLDDTPLQLDQQGELTTGDSVRVTLNVENWGIFPDRSVDIVLIDRNLDSAEVDTLFMAALPPFGIRDSVTVLWRLKNRAGRHILEAIADPANAIVEEDETNNRTAVEVDVLGALSAVPFLPLPSQTVANAETVLGVRSGEDQFHITGEFELSASGDFQDTATLRSGNIAATEGIILWRPANLRAGSYFWRARLSDGQTTGPWADVRHFVVTSSVPERQVVWQQDGAIALSRGTGENVVLSDDSSVGRTMSPPPIRFNAAEASFLSEGVTGTAVLCTDGTYLYVKRFYTPQDLYPGSDLFARIGTGFNGTVAGQNYGIVTETPIQSISATFHSDGFIYSEHRTARSLLRISPVTGRIDTVEVPDRLLDLSRGLPFDDHALITSDGEFIYNVSAGINGIKRSGWTVRVFDPANAWRIVRQFTVQPTETGFGYLLTDGAIADGQFIYLIEYGTGLTHRVRVVDAQTGAFVEEFESDQAQTDILGGQFDWVNNVVWLGQLEGGMVYRYPGQRLPEFGTLTSEPVGPASAWHTVTTTLSGTGKAEVNLLGEIDNNTFAPLSQWQNLPPGTIDLSGIGSSTPRLKIQIKLYGEGLNPSPGLQTWTTAYQPLSDIGLSNLQAEPFEITELQPVYLHLDVQNRGPLDVALGTSVAFYSGVPALGRLIGRVAVPEDSPLGRIVPLRLAWQTAQWAGQHIVTARLENFQGQAIFPGREVALTEPVRIAPSSDRDVPTIEIAALDALGEVRPEDYLPSQPTFRISMRDTAGIDLSSIRLSLSGTDEAQESHYESEKIKDRAVTPMTLSFVYTPNALVDGRYTLNVEASDRLGNGPAKMAISFQVSSILAIENALVAPNPVSDTGHFTFILSRPSEVTVRIYTLAGRLVQRIEEPFARAGYNQIFWDGRDADGQVLSNNTYLYTLTAENGESQARIKDKLIVYR